MIFQSLSDHFEWIHHSFAGFPHTQKSQSGILMKESGWIERTRSNVVISSGSLQCIFNPWVTSLRGGQFHLYSAQNGPLCRCSVADPVLHILRLFPTCGATRSAAGSASSRLGASSAWDPHRMKWHARVVHSRSNFHAARALKGAWVTAAYLHEWGRVRRLMQTGPRAASPGGWGHHFLNTRFIHRAPLPTWGGASKQAVSTATAASGHVSVLPVVIWSLTQCVCVCVLFTDVCVNRTSFSSMKPEVLCIFVTYVVNKH